MACGSFQAPDHDFPSELELSLTATDSSGLANTASVQLLPLTTTLRFATNPTGLTLTFNGANATAPFDRTVIVNSTNSVSAPSPQNLRGSGKQVFKSWSDGATEPAHNRRSPERRRLHGQLRQTLTATPPSRQHTPPPNEAAGHGQRRPDRLRAPAAKSIPSTLIASDRTAKRLPRLLPSGLRDRRKLRRERARVRRLGSSSCRP